MTKTTLKSKVDAADDARFDDVLDGLLAAWARAPHLDIAAQIDAASRLCATPTPPELRGKKRTAIDGWLEREARGRAADVPALLEALADVESTDAKVRLERLAARGPDPRLDAAIVALLEAPPWRATSTKPVWEAVFERLAAVRDVRLAARLDALDARIAATVAATMRRLDAQPGEEALAPGRRAVREAGARPAEVARRARGPARRSAPRRRGTTSPGSSRPRTRASTTSGHASSTRTRCRRRAIRAGSSSRCSAAASSTRRIRRASTSCSRRTARRGSASSARSCRRDCTYEHGFLVTATVKAKKPDLVERVEGHPMWSTVHRLRGSARIALHPVMRALREVEISAARRPRPREARVRVARATRRDAAPDRRCSPTGRVERACTPRPGRKR